VKRGTAKDLVILTAGMVAVVIGANYLVEEAVFFANYFHLPQTLIGISIIAVGTSLPELIVTLTALRKGQTQMAIGNIIGSNIFRTTLVMALPALIAPLNVTSDTLILGIPFLLISLVLFGFSVVREKISAFDGIIFVLLYLIFLGQFFNIF